MHDLMDKDTCAAARFYRTVRDFALSARPWDSDVIWYETRPDEALDLTLISERVYGQRDEFLAVMAAAGLDMVERAMPQKKIALPNAMRLNELKRQSGFESQDEYRESGAPVWSQGLDFFEAPPRQTWIGPPDPGEGEGEENGGGNEEESPGVFPSLLIHEAIHFPL